MIHFCAVRLTQQNGTVTIVNMKNDDTPTTPLARQPTACVFSALGDECPFRRDG
ncbi:MAG: hypothetical protein LBE75_09220 [Burkholderiales bacterium]|nr:hypothetical protein [Burkholderiales bacterium]